MSLCQALPAALEGKIHRDCEYGGLHMYPRLHATRLLDDTDGVQRYLMLVNRPLRNSDTYVTLSNQFVDNVVYA